MGSRIGRWILAIACLLVVAVAAEAAPPQDATYQGLLLDSVGDPVAGPVNIEIGVWDQPTGGTLLYGEAHSGVALVDGVFNLLLGTGTGAVGNFDADLFATQNRYLEVFVNAEVMTPRQPFSSVAYAFHAQQCVDASLLTGFDVGTIVGEARDGMVTDSVLVTHSGDPGAHHDAYEDAEAVLAMGPNSVGNPLHHNRYADGEAIAAMGSQANGNPLNHARYSDSESVAAIQAADGPGSGLNADLLDGLNSAAFMPAGTDQWVNTTGDSMTGALTLPSDGLAVGSNQLIATSGKVGVGTNTPISTLSADFDGAGASVHAHNGPRGASSPVIRVGLFGDVGTLADPGQKTGVFGHVIANQGPNYGVLGSADSFNPTGNVLNTGVLGRAGNSPTSYGVFGEAGFGPAAVEQEMYGVYGQALLETPESYGVFGRSDSSSGHGGHFANLATSPGSQVGLWAGTYWKNIIEGHDVGSDGASLNLRFAVDRLGNVSADGTFSPGGADFAELLPAGETTEPGDVVAIGPAGTVAPSSEPYQTTVVGVHSSKPGVLGGAGIDADLAGRTPVAVLGVVPVKATAENGAIAPGDLLATSSIPGHAMKAEPALIQGVPVYPTGAVLGKALEGLDEAIGVIEMLVTLQ